MNAPRPGRRCLCLAASLWLCLAAGAARGEMPSAKLPITAASESPGPAASPTRPEPKKSAAPPPASRGMMRLLPPPRSKIGRRDPFRPDVPVASPGMSPGPGVPPVNAELPSPPPLPGGSPQAAVPAPPSSPAPALPGPGDLGPPPETPAPVTPSVQLRFTGMIMMPAEPPVALIEVTNGSNVEYISAVQGDRVLRSYRLLSANIKRIVLLRRQDNYRLTLVVDQPVMLHP